ncbi:MAG TPA: HK97 family phage prohead protease [Pseudonocardiaceae bacterium]|jgi:HK97 family phage prohead protease
MSAPNSFIRAVEFRLAATDGQPGDGLTLEGYAAVFDQRTEIDSWEGTFIETIRRGAFRKTIRERTPVLQFDHGRHPLVGSIPIGRIEDLREDDEGLFVQARLSDNWLIEPVRDAIADDAVNGMSFRFEVIRQEWRDKDGKLIKDDEELMRLLWNPGDRGPIERTLIELRVPELGPVVFPAYENTTVSVRAKDVASSLLGTPELVREARHALAADIADPVVDDPALRGEVARAVLFPATLPKSSPDRSGETDAPPPEAPVVPVPDAPPTDGHPSPPDRAQRAAYARRAYVTRHGVGRTYT